MFHPRPLSSPCSDWLPIWSGLPGAGSGTLKEKPQARVLSQFGFFQKQALNKDLSVSNSFWGVGSAIPGNTGGEWGGESGKGFKCVSN